jgi:hypothetical protein
MRSRVLTLFVALGFGLGAVACDSPDYGGAGGGARGPGGMSASDYGSQGDEPGDGGERTDGDASEAADASRTVPTLGATGSPASSDAASPPAASETDAAPVTPAIADAATPLPDGGCECGCADACLTVLMEACVAPTPALLLVCPKVPATCACAPVCVNPPPTPPTLDACVASFVLTGK